MRLELQDWLMLVAILAAALVWTLTGKDAFLFPLGVFVGGFAFRLGYRWG